MDWKKAKDFTIILLLLLNIALLLLINFRQQQYKLTDKQYQAIKKVLEDNQITLNTPLMKEFVPMKSLVLSSANWDIDMIKEAFWDKDAEVKITLEEDKVILINEKETVTIQNNEISYLNVSENESLQNFDEESVLKYTDKYIERFQAWFNHTILDTVQKNAHGYTITYCQTFYNKPIFSNKIIVTVTNTGLSQLQMNYLKPEQFIGEKREICSPDEALFSFLQHKINEDIAKIDLGYALEGYDNTENEVNAIPYYKIVTSKNNVAYKINAYTGKLMMLQL